jgi:hypothetical protein
MAVNTMGAGVLADAMYILEFSLFAKTLGWK